MINGKAIAVVYLLAGVLAASTARADCRAKLTEMEQRLASSSIDAKQRGAMEQLRSQAADLCARGLEPAAMQLLGTLEMILLPPTQHAAAPGSQGNASTKASLTDEFLAGTWCSMTGQERVQLVFSVDGTYRPCFPAGGQGYSQCGSPRTTSDWLAGFGVEESQSADEIVLRATKARARPMIYRRGACNQHGR